MTIANWAGSMASWWREFNRRTDGILCMNARNLDFVFRANPRRHHHLVNDKVEAKAILESGGIRVPRTISVIESFFELHRIDRIVDTETEFVIKPANGSGGGGILLAASTTGNGVRTASGRFVDRTGLRRHLTEILYGSFSGSLGDRALVEERIHPHPMFEEIWATGLPDIRLIVHRGRPVMSMIRLPTQASGGTANLHQGGVGVGLDLRDGRPLRAVCRGRKILRHPDSGFDLSRVAIPAWKDVVETAVNAARLFPLGYLGVDLVLDADGGVRVLELNARPGLQIQIATGIGLREALA